MLTTRPLPFGGPASAVSGSTSASPTVGGNVEVVAEAPVYLRRLQHAIGPTSASRLRKRILANEPQASSGIPAQRVRAAYYAEEEEVLLGINE